MSLQEANNVELFYPTEETAMEYLRSCGHNQRSEFRHYRQCLDWVHLGYLVISHNTQSFLNILMLSHLKNKIKKLFTVNGPTKVRVITT